MAASAREEHQRHQAAPDEEREECSQAKGDPAVLVHYGIVGRVPHRGRPHSREDQDDDQGGQDSDLAQAELFHVLGSWSSFAASATRLPKSCGTDRSGVGHEVGGPDDEQADHAEHQHR